MGKKTKSVSTRQRKQRLYAGNEPADGSLIGTFEHWGLYERKKVGSLEWRNFKLISLTPRQDKANFHFAYSVKAARFARADALKLLKEYEPAVYAWLTGALVGIGVRVGDA